MDHAPRIIPDNEGVAPDQTRDVPGWTAWAGTTALIAGVTVGGTVLQDEVPREAVGLLYLAAAVVAGGAYGLGLAMYAAALGFVSWDLFFFHPLYSITIGSLKDGIAMGVFVLVAGVTGSLASRLRTEVRSGRARIESLRRIGEFSRRLGEPAIEAELLAEVARQAAGIGRRGIVLLLQNGALQVQASEPPGESLDEAGWAAAAWSVQARRGAGHGTRTQPSSAWRLLPMGTVRGVLGVLGVRPGSGRVLDAPTQQSLAALADQAAVALERVMLMGQTARSAAMAETQTLRTALLNSLSHDLRTPLTGIRGAAETLELTWDSSGPAGRADLLASIQEDVGRMTRFLANIMDLTRVESGTLRPRLASIQVEAVIHAAAARIPGLRDFQVSVHDGTALVLADPALMEQALVNVLENAHRYAPAGSPIHIGVEQRSGHVVIDVADEGMGIPAKDLPHVFDSFYRARRGDRTAPGTGLGLAIARGLMEAMGGQIGATSPRPGGLPGALISLQIPVAP